MSFFMVSRHVKHLDFVGTRILCMQWGQNIPACVYAIYLWSRLHDWLFCLQGMQLTTNSSIPSMRILTCWWDSWTREFSSFQMICGTLHIGVGFRSKRHYCLKFHEKATFQQFAVDTYSGKTKFGKVWISHKVILRQLIFQKIYKGKPCEWA